VALGALLGLSAAVAFGFWRGLGTASAPDVIRITPIDVNGAEENFPAFSPDGRSIAYLRNVNEIMLRSLNSPTPLSLVKSEAGFGLQVPFWSADGTHVCYQDHFEIWCVGAAGGVPQRLIADASVAGFTTDGKTLVLGRSGNGKVRLYSSSPPGAEPRPLPIAPLPAEISSLSFSPDGARLLAFSYYNLESWLIPYPKGTPNRLPFRGEPAWYPDGRHVVVAESNGSAKSLFIADTESSQRRTLLRDTTSYARPTVSPDGSQIVYASGQYNYDVIEYSMNGEPVRPIANSLRSELMGTWSPSGDVVLFWSDASGSMSLWTRRTDGSAATMIADPGPENLEAGLARYSPDGRRIAYSTGMAHGALEVVASTGGRPVRVVSGSTPLYLICWSADGAWLWFTKDQKFWKVPSEGGEPVLMKATWAYPGDHSPDGRWISYGAEDGIHLMSADGKQDRVIRADRNASMTQFGAGGKLLYIMPFGAPVLTVLDADSGRDVRTIRFDIGAGPTGSASSVHPDGKRVLLSVGGRHYNLWMVEGFARPATGWLRWFRHWEVPSSPSGEFAEAR